MKRLLWLGIILGKTLTSFAQTYTLSSPDFKLKINIQNLGQVQFQATYDDKNIFTNAVIGLDLAEGQSFGKDDKIKNAKTTYHNDLIRPEIKIKNAEIADEYNELIINYRENYSIVFRAYNDALAYRFVAALSDSIVTVRNELFEVQLMPETEAYFQKLEEKENYLNNYERPYELQAFGTLLQNTKTQLPLLVNVKNPALKLLFTEANFFDYAGMYFEADKTGKMKAVFPAVVKTTRMNPKPQWGWDRTVVPLERHDYIAKTAGVRDFPWRVVAIAKQDKELMTNEIVYKLSSPSKLTDASWIKPGKVAWDWWNDWNITGVDFKVGINTATYKKYIDFAAQYGLPYIIMDDGWYVLGDLTKVVPELDIEALVAYGKQKNVGIILWGSWKTLDDNMVIVMDLWQKWGIKGMKIDFMDRDDQAVVNFYERCAQEAAKRQLLVDFHGAYKPAGLHRMYPNVLNFEGVQGLEQNKWGGQNANPDMAVKIPFIRMFAGPLDYTPGAMLNAQKHEYAPINARPMSLGTRCQQLAMYVVYEAPLQMLSDSPTNYEKEPECMAFLSKVPTVWDKTLALDCQVGEYISVARKNGADWYVGAMTNWKERNLTLDFSFLESGAYQVDIWQDGINAAKNGMDYKKISRSITAGEKLNIHLAPGGGWVARVYR